MECLKLRSEWIAGNARRGSAPQQGWRARALRVASLGAIAICLCGCRLDMHIQPKYLPEEPTDFFGDGRSERAPVAGTVARGQLRLDELIYTGKVNGVEADEFPFPITRADLERGQRALQHLLHSLPRLHGQWVRHDRPARHSRIRRRTTFSGCARRPLGISSAVMTNGFGAMYSYASRVDPADRWRIAAYIRVLQLSRNASIDDVPEAERQKLTQETAANSSGPSK